MSIATWRRWRERWFAGLDWKGFEFIVAFSAVNALRRNSTSRALWEDPLRWLLDVMDATLTGVFVAVPVPSFAQRSIVGEALAAWRGITAEQLIGALLLGLAACTPTALQLVRSFGVSAAWPDVSHLMASSVIKALCLLLAVVLADRAVDRGGRRTLAYATAVVVGVVIGSILYWLAVMFLSDLTGPGHALGEKMKVIPMVRYTFLANSILDWLIIGGLAVFIYADRRDGQKILANLHIAQIERSTQARQMLESRLQAMQARIEPRFLFNTLARIKQLHDANAALGGSDAR